MRTEILSGLIVAVVVAVASMVWRHRHYLPLIRTSLTPGRQVRVSMAALLRVKDDDSYVLFHMPYRPGVYGPPGGVFKIDSSARHSMDRLQFVEQRVEGRKAQMDRDLRGFVPSQRAIGFMAWFDKGEGRES